MALPKNFENLSNDVLFKIALDMKPNDIESFCLTSKRFNRLICANDYFWQRKYQKDFKEKPHIPTYKEIYELKTTQNKNLVKVLNDFINYDEFSYENKKKIYDEFLKESIKVIDKYKRKPADILAPKALQLKAAEIEMSENPRLTELDKKENRNVIDYTYGADYLVSIHIIEKFLINFFDKKISPFGKIKEIILNNLQPYLPPEEQSDLSEYNFVLNYALLVIDAYGEIFNVEISHYWGKKPGEILSYHKFWRP